MTQLDADGTLAVTYMGTDPPLNVVGGLDGKELNYEEMDDEHRRLLAVIRDATSETKVQPTDKVVLRCQVCTPVGLRLRTNTSVVCVFCRTLLIGKRGDVDAFLRCRRSWTRAGRTTTTGGREEG